MNLTIMQRICGLLLPAITLALLITLAACGGSTPSDRASTIDGGSTPEASQSDGASTIDWEKVGAYGESCREPLGSIRAQLEVDSTTAELSDAVGEVIDAWESQDNPDALEAYHRAIADFLEELKRVVDSQPRDNAAQETLATLEGAEIGERLDDAYEAAEEAWAKTSPIVRYLLDESESPCFQDMDAPSLGYVGGGAVDYGNWCGPVSCFTVWSKYRDAGKLTLEGGSEMSSRRTRSCRCPNAPRTWLSATAMELSTWPPAVNSVGTYVTARSPRMKKAPRENLQAWGWSWNTKCRRQRGTWSC